MKWMLGARLLALWLLIGSLGIGDLSGQSSKHAALPLEKTEWKLIWLGGTKIEAASPQQAPFLQLDPEGQRVSGSGGCNRLTGAYEREGSHLRFTQMAMSRMACLHGNQTEADFSKALDQVRGWKVLRGKLLLMDAHGRVVAKFAAARPSGESGR